MEINADINTKTQTIGESLEKMKAKILSEIEDIVKEIETFVKEIKEDNKTEKDIEEAKIKVLEWIKSITEEISELIKRINRYNELVDRQKSEKRLRDLLDKKNSELKDLIKTNKLPENLQQKIQELITSSNMTPTQYDRIITKLEQEKTDITKLQQSVNTINWKIDEIKNQLISKLET
ncbi:MAG: hypothetical protein CMI31_12885, partial [Opitutae bacterium]|nr:hypothetical protein [Opitutae bacterium]